MERHEQLQEDYVSKNGLVGHKPPKSKVQQRRRYYLHDKVRENSGTSKVKLNVRKRTIYVFSMDDVMDAEPYITALRDEFGYNIQTEIK